MKNIAFARGKNIKISPRKVRLVIDYIRGQSIRNAYGFLENDIRRANPLVLNIVKSAVANALQKLPDTDPDSLYITEAYADGGMVLKRMRPRAMGRGMTVRKRTSHVYIAVGQ